MRYFQNFVLVLGIFTMAANVHADTLGGYACMVVGATMVSSTRGVDW